MLNRYRRAAATITVLGTSIAILLTSIGCSDSSGTDRSGSLTGVLRDAVVQGVSFSTTSGASGITNSTGTFSYNEGDDIQFMLGSLTLGSVPASGIITPIELSEGSDDKLQNLLVLFQSLDADENPLNGITIPAAAANAITGELDLTAAPATFASPANTALRAAQTAGGINGPIMTIAEANAFFLDEILPIIGVHVWAQATASGAVVMRSNSSGSYIFAQAGAADGAGHAGIELGTISPGGFDARGYWLNPSTHSADTNGEWGLSHALDCERILVSGNAISTRDCQGQTTEITKLANEPNGIVGAWALGSSTAINTPLLIFFPNGRFLFADPFGDSGVPSCGPAGLEFGNYTYTAAARVLKISSLLYDTDGCAGLSDGSAATAAGMSFVLNPGATIVTGNNEGIPFIMYRVSK